MLTSRLCSTLAAAALALPVAMTAALWLHYLGAVRFAPLVRFSSLSYDPTPFVGLLAMSGLVLASLVPLTLIAGRRDSFDAVWDALAAPLLFFVGGPFVAWALGGVLALVLIVAFTIVRWIFGTELWGDWFVHLLQIIYAAGWTTALALGARDLWRVAVPQSPWPSFKCVAKGLTVAAAACACLQFGFSEAPRGAGPDRHARQPQTHAQHQTGPAATGTLTVLVKRAGALTAATVTLDGVALQKQAPIVITTSSGAHRLRIEPEGFAPVERIVEVAAGTRTVAKFELER